MKKRQVLFALTAAWIFSAVSAMQIMPAFAAVGWEKTEKGWVYHDTDSSVYFDGWHWIDDDDDGTAECYYFADSCLVTDTVTPDGYTVDEAGAWTVDGIVQTRVLGAQHSGAVRKVESGLSGPRIGPHMGFMPQGQ